MDKIIKQSKLIQKMKVESPNGKQVVEEFDEYSQPGAVDHRYHSRNNS